MVSTFVIEFACAVYVALRFPASLFRNLVVLVLLCLSSFQLAEFQVCQGPDSAALAWTRIGLVGISLLPAMGMHLMSLLTRPSMLVPIGYLFALAYAVVFALVPGATGAAECHGNYVLLNIKPGLVALIYDGYYSLFLAIAIVELILRLSQRNPPLGFGFSPRLIGLMLAGYLSFIVPMAVVFLVAANLVSATPSIMCGFALFLAFILTFAIMPAYARESNALNVAPLPA